MSDTGTAAAPSFSRPRPAAKRYRRGLVVGKFAPLHRGHELLIARALRECEEVVILSYQKPEIPGYPPEVRERWLAALFPQATRLVLDDARVRALLPPGVAPVPVPGNGAEPVEDRRFCGFVCERVLGVTVDAVFTSEEYGDGFADELTRCFRERRPGAPAVRHVCVDLQRLQRPISGTLLRGDVHGHRRWLSPAVYASFVRRVCLLGGEATGKTTLARELARMLGTRWVPEHGRKVWTEKGGRLDFEDMERIARAQAEREDELARRANRYLLCDTSPLTTLFFSRHLFGAATPELERMAERRYDLTVLCAPDFPFVQDGIRHGGDFRHRQHEWYVRELESRGIPYLLVTGSVDERIDQLRAAILSLPISDPLVRPQDPPA
ncbi:MAG TPA: AAA family ATPase [Longimicrobium sp.]|nr:AAA family ATPase [Longimicrobium sp.]